jgi:hypothetical protein
MLELAERIGGFKRGQEEEEERRCFPGIMKIARKSPVRLLRVSA